MYGFILQSLVGCLLISICFIFGGPVPCLLSIFVIVSIKVFIGRRERCARRRPGTVTHSKWYLANKRSFQPKLIIKPKSVDSTWRRQVVRRDIRASNACKFRNSECDAGNIDSGFVSSFSSLTDMTSPCSPSRYVGSPVSRGRNGDDRPADGDSTPRRSSDMSVGEFPLISLVSSLHEAVSPKPHRLKPSPLSIRIQPPQIQEVTCEPVVDPVVSVLKQIASNKRVLAPSQEGEEPREKRNRAMPRHDLTHSLLESQLTTANSSRDVNSSKRERDEGHSPSSANGMSSSNSAPLSAPKRLCARSLRSNEILSSLSSSISLVSPPHVKSYTGKRKNISFDKYKKLRKMEISSNQVVSLLPSPIKVDKSVTTAELGEKPPSTPLPVIPIKRDEISERVVSRAMVSALLKSTVAKLMMSGDPSVFPVPNGDQLRQPEVTPPQFGPPKSAVTATSLPSPASAFPNKTPSDTLFGSEVKTSSPATITAQTAVTSPPNLLPSAVSSSQTLFPPIKPQATLPGAVPSFGLDPKGPAGTSGSNLQFGIPQTSSADQTASPGLGIPSTVSQGGPVFGLPTAGSLVSGFKTPSTQSGGAVSAASPVVTSGVSSSVGSATVVSSVPTFGVPSTATAGIPATPTFGVLSTGSGVSPGVSSFSAVAASTPSTSATVQSPVFAANQTTKGLNLPQSTSSPSFNLAPSSSAGPTPTFSFGGSTEVKTSTAPPSFASVVAGTSIAATPTFGLGLTTSSTNMFTASKSNTPAIKFGESNPVTTASIFGGGMATPILSFGATPTTTVSASTVSSTVTNAPIFGTTTSVTSAPMFGGAPGQTDAKNVNNAVTTSSSIFGGASNSIFNGTTSAPVFGGGTTSSTVFGTSPAVTSTSLFATGSVPALGGATTTTAPVFGASLSATTSAPMFGSLTSTSTTSTAPIFGATTSTASSLFGGVSSSSTTPIFGMGTTTAPIFGGANASTPIFGSMTSMTPVTTSTPLFGGVSTTTSSSSGLFGGVTTTSAQAPLFGAGSSTNTFSSGGFGGAMSPAAKPGEGLFGMPSSTSGFKASSPFQVGSSAGEGSSGTVLGSASGVQGKPFEFGGGKPSSGGFTFKPTGGPVAPFTSQTPAAVGSTSTFSQLPQTQAPFTFAGGAGVANTAGSAGSPFVFGAPQGQTSTPGNAVATPQAAKPFQFNPTPAQSVTPTFGQQAFAPTFPQSSPAPNLSFAAPNTPNAQTGFQFNAGGQPPPTTPGNPGGLFSIGTGSSGTKARDRRDRRRRV